MQIKSALKILGTLLLLLGVFGYIFPHWGNVAFTNNENLFHVVSGVLILFLANVSLPWQRRTLLVAAFIFLGLGIYGFILKHPADFKIKRVTAQLDMVDNGFHLAFGLSFAWFWLKHKKSTSAS